MALPVYPGNLPHGSVMEDLSLQQPFPSPSVSQVEDGPDIKRRKAYTEIEHLSMRLRPLTDAQFSSFKSFVKNTLDHATSHFMMPVQIDGWACTTRRVFFVFDEGSPPYRHSGAAGRKHNVAFVLGVYPAGVT